MISSCSVDWLHGLPSDLSLIQTDMIIWRLDWTWVPLWVHLAGTWWDWALGGRAPVLLAMILASATGLKIALAVLDTVFLLQLAPCASGKNVCLLASLSQVLTNISKFSLARVSRLNSSYPLSLSSYLCQCFSTLITFTLVSSFLLHWGVQNWSECPRCVSAVLSEDHLPWPLGSALPNAAQDAIGALCWEGSLLVHGPLGVHQDPQVLFPEQVQTGGPSLS